jgi:hypothetical protein
MTSKKTMKKTMETANLNSGFQISVGTVMTILLIHFIGDFVLQTQDQAANKSTSNRYLALHVFNYSLFTTVAWFMFLPAKIMFPFVFIITFVAHFLTDYFTSRWSKGLWEKKEVHDFFVAVGFDQFMHAVQLFYMYVFLTGL